MPIEISFKNKNVLVTGGVRGIGFAISKAFAEADANVIIVDIDPEDGEDVKKALSELSKYGTKIAYYRMDVSNRENVKEVAGKILNDFGKVDIVINNAGINRDNLFKKMEDKEWDAVISVDLTGVYNVTKAFIDKMIENNYGVIISISSIVGLDGNIGQANYAAAKAGVVGFTYSIGKELARYGIRAVAVAPGFTRTRMVENIPDKVKEHFLKLIPMRRFAEPEEIARVIRFLASDEASYINATVIRIDGGLRI
ncbi:MAG: beta-ketoacyl-ACP reductase [Candidatus Njordarchaeia archaeon]